MTSCRTSRRSTRLSPRSTHAQSRVSCRPRRGSSISGTSTTRPRYEDSLGSKALQYTCTLHRHVLQTVASAESSVDTYALCSVGSRRTCSSRALFVQFTSSLFKSRVRRAPDDDHEQETALRHAAQRNASQARSKSKTSKTTASSAHTE